MCRYRVLFSDCIRTEIGGGYFVLARLANFFSQHPEYGVVPFVLINNAQEFVTNYINKMVTWIPLEIPERISSLNRRTNVGRLITTVVSSPLFLLSFLIRTVRMLKRHRITLIHANGVTAFILITLPAKVAGIKIIYHLHDALLTQEEGGTMGTLARSLLLLWMKRFADAIVVVSEFAKKTIMSKDEILEKKIHVLHNGLDISQIRQPTPKRLQDGTPLILSFGTLSDRKGFHIGIEAMRILRDKHGVKVKYRIIGDGPQRSFLENLIWEENLDGQVELLGFQTDVHHYVAQSDIVLIPSIWEDPLPLVVIESMANSKIIIASKVGGIPEMISNEEGFLVPKEDPEAIAEKILFIMGHSEHANELADNAYDRVKKEFTIEGMVMKLKKIYQEVLHEDPAS